MTRMVSWWGIFTRTHVAVAHADCIRGMGTGSQRELSSPCFSPDARASPSTWRYFEDFGACLATAALSLSFLAALDLDCFWDACFCVAFGDLSPMVFEATRPRGGVKPSGTLNAWLTSTAGISLCHTWASSRSAGEAAVTTLQTARDRIPPWEHPCSGSLAMKTRKLFLPRATGYPSSSCRRGSPGAPRF